MRVVRSNQQILWVFHKTVASRFNGVLSPEKESMTLAAIRDALLPKLMSGEIRVPDEAEIAEETT